ncbi:MAG: hypothetical protein ACXWKP_17695 [Bradyrhizobium sp.]
MSSETLGEISCHLRRGQLGFILGFLGNRLIQCRLERTAIDLGDNVAVPDLLAFNELYGRQFPIDLAAYRDRITGLHRARSSQTIGTSRVSADVTATGTARGELPAVPEGGGTRCQTAAASAPTMMTMPTTQSRCRLDFGRAQSVLILVGYTTHGMSP